MNCFAQEDQAWYLAEGSGQAAAAEAHAVLDTALQAKSALISAIDQGLIKSSYDYAAIESSLVPAMLLSLGASEVSCGDDVIYSMDIHDYCIYRVHDGYISII